MKFFKCVIFMALLSACNLTEQVGSRMPETVAVTPSQVQDTLNTANVLFPENNTLYQASIAQVVFPKILKAGLLFGGTYGEGYLVRDGIILANVRLIGGNTGLSAGAQAYSQVVYILDEDALAAFRRDGKIALNGTLNYAHRGKSITDTFGKLSPTQPVYTTIFNQSGYLAGISLDGTLMQVMRRQ